MKKFLGYTRVSTAKQGERGVSLQEQHDAIAGYAERHGLEIASWFEERETAAKRGRAVFNHVLKLLGEEKAHGVIIHKIDRSARNLKDRSEERRVGKEWSCGWTTQRYKKESKRQRR